MKILQLNLWEGRLIRRALKVIQQERPDIICLQESFSCGTFTAHPDRTFNSVQLIAQQMKYDHIFFSPFYGFNIGDSYVEYGNAIISRFPLENTQTIFTNGRFSPRLTVANYNKDTRNVQLAQIILAPAQSITLINYHGYAIPNPQGNALSVKTMRRARRAVDSYYKSGPLIICGDMNVVANSAPMKTWDGIARSLTAEYHIPTTLSILGKTGDLGFTGNTGVACDHILINKEICVKKFYAIEELISDHKGLILEFELENRAER